MLCYGKLLCVSEFSCLWTLSAERYTALCSWVPAVVHKTRISVLIGSLVLKREEVMVKTQIQNNPPFPLEVVSLCSLSMLGSPREKMV